VTPGGDVLREALRAPAHRDYALFSSVNHGATSCRELCASDQRVKEISLRGVRFEDTEWTGFEPTQVSKPAGRPRLRAK
jgi:hypothetical protein